MYRACGRGTEIALPAGKGSVRGPARLKQGGEMDSVVAAQGLPQAPHEGPRDYAARVVRERPELAPAIEKLARAYLAARYLDDRPREAALELAEALGELRA